MEWTLISLSCCFIVISGCKSKIGLTPAVQTGTTLYLAQATFRDEIQENGETLPVPGPARLVIWTKTANGWIEEVLQDQQSNVFHKAAWFTPVAGESGILTIGGSAAFLKVWRKQDNQWHAESLWNPTFGGEFDRLRDFEVADVTGDGREDIVIATHDQGIVAVLTWNDGQYQATELCRRPDIFVHEVEVGDVEDDECSEIFATPSQPNKFDGSAQPGEIVMFGCHEGEWRERQVESLKTRHAKEILCVTLPGVDKAVLLAALEGEEPGMLQAGDSTRIRMYRFDVCGITSVDVASLPGCLCRCLTFGDTDGDGRKELIVSTAANGIWKLTPGPQPGFGAWQKQLLATGTSGFEHAACLADLNNDGIDKIYVASDDQQELRCYWFNGHDYSVRRIGKLTDYPITFNLTAHQIDSED
jgi:hypothetical protein